MTDRRRRQKEQRAAKREAEKKQEARKELGRRLGTAFLFGLVVVGIFVVGAYFGDDEGALPGGYEDFRAQPTACGAEAPEAEAVQTFDAPEPQEDVTAGSVVTVTLDTSCGEIVMDLDPVGAPQTANSFVFLTREGFFDGQVFYRIEEERFAPFHAVFLAQEIPTDFSAEAIWNSSCLRCHTTDPRPRFGDFTKMDTEVAEFGIACETCHGPGQEHVLANRNPLRRYASHFGDDGDPSIVNPRRLSAARASQTCGLCHSVHVFRDERAAYDYSEHGPSFRPGDDIEKFWTIVRAGGPETPVLRANLKRDPHWLANLHAKPEAWAQVGRERFAVRAREASPAEAERLWPRMLDAYPQYRSYQERAGRPIPLVLLERA